MRRFCFSFVSRPLALAAGSALAVLLAAPQAAHAQLTVFTDRPTFTAANPGLTGENFESSTGGFNRTIIPSTNTTLDSTTSAVTQLTIFPGLRIQAVGTDNNEHNFFYNNLATASSTVFSTGNGTNVLTTNFFPDSQDITFPGAGAVTAFGADLGGTGTGGNYSISVFDTSDVQIGLTTTITSTSGTFSFFGVTSTVAIGRVNIAAPGFETTDNILFGPASASTAAPEPGSLALLLPALGMAGIVLRRKRK